MAFRSTAGTMGGGGVGGNRPAPTPAPATQLPPGSPGSTQGPMGATWNGLGTVGTKESINATGGTWYRDGNGNWVQDTGARPNAGNRTAPRSGQTQQFFGGAGSSGGRGVGGSGTSLFSGGGSGGVGGGGGGFGGGGMPDFSQMFGGGGGAGGAGGAGGGGGGGFDFGGGGGGGGGPLNLTAQKSPELERSQQMFEQQMQGIKDQQAKTDQNLQFQIGQYKERLGEGPTTRSIERAASAIRDQMAGMGSDAEASAAAGGRTQGYGQSGLAEGAQRALAGASADITLGRQQQLDNLLLGGQNIMAAPGQRELDYSRLGVQAYGQSPYQGAATQNLQDRRLGLDAFLGQGDLAVRRQAAQTQAQGNPLDWFRMLYGG